MFGWVSQNEAWPFYEQPECHDALFQGELSRGSSIHILNNPPHFPKNRLLMRPDSLEDSNEGVGCKRGRETSRDGTAVGNSHQENTDKTPFAFLRFGRNRPFFGGCALHLRQTSNPPRLGK